MMCRYTILMLAIVSIHVWAANGVYLGAGIGGSVLEPQQEFSGYPKEYEWSGKLFVGTDIGDNFGLEAAYAHLGKLELQDLSLSYNTYGLNGIVYWPSNSDKLSVYAKAGINYLDMNAKGDVEVEHNVSLATGFGVRWNVSEQLALSGEYNFYDSDYGAAFIQLAYYFGRNGEQEANVQTTAVKEYAQELSTKSTPEIEAPPVIRSYEARLSSGHFASNSKDLSFESGVVLHELVETMKQYPQSIVVITGYTDSTGQEQFNQKLSEARAQSVADELEKQGIEASRMRVYGAGESNPIASNETSEGRALNRRVELKIPEFEYTEM